MTAPVRLSRSSEELQMRATLMPWLRSRWPTARIVHELVVHHTRRIDMAAITPETIIGVEIKSSRDTLDRLEDQMSQYLAHLPFVILALAPKWRDQQIWGRTVIVETAPPAVTGELWYNPDRSIAAPLLRLLWAQELRNIAARLRLLTGPKMTMTAAIEAITRRATGDEIVREACRELRARDAFPTAAWHPQSDPPILATASTFARIGGSARQCDGAPHRLYRTS